MKELKYVNHLLEERPHAPVQVYGVTWPSMYQDLTPDEQMNRCKVNEILALLQDMKKKFPNNVQILQCK